MLNALLQFDQLFSLALTRIIPHNILFDSIFAFLSLKGNSIITWAIIILLLIVFEEQKDKRFIGYFFASFIITSFITNDILKNIFERPRPIFHIASSFISCPSDFSFPSGHAAGAFSAAVILAHFDAKRKWIYYTIATLVAYSRIYLGCHYFLDVVGGALFGSLISILVLQIHSQLQKKSIRKRS